MKHRLCTVSLIALLLVISACTRANPAEEPAQLADRTATLLQMPAENPASIKLATFIRTIRTGNEDSIAVYVRNNMAEFLQAIPIDEHVGNLMEFHEPFTQIVFDSYVRDEPHYAQGLFLNTYSQEWVTIGMEVESEAPHRVFLINVEPAGPPE